MLNWFIIMYLIYGSNSKRKRKESTYLRDYCTSTTTGNEYSEFDESSLIYQIKKTGKLMHIVEFWM